MQRLLDAVARPTALIAANNQMAVGALAWPDALGISIPTELSFISFDDLDWYELATPQITAVAQPAYDTGVAAARPLLGRLSSPDGAPRVVRLATRTGDAGVHGHGPGGPAIGAFASQRRRRHAVYLAQVAGLYSRTEHGRDGSARYRQSHRTASRSRVTMGSFRTDDIDAWNAIIPLFEAEHPDIKVVFDPTNNEEYNSQIRAQLEGGVGPDLVTCRTFDLSQDLFKSGYLADLTDLPGMQESFTPFARGLRGRPTMARSPTACRSQRRSMASSTTQTCSPSWASSPRRPRVSSSPSSTPSRQQRPDLAGIALTTLTTWPADIMGWDTLWPTFTHGEETRQALMAGDLDVLTEPRHGRRGDLARPLAGLHAGRLPVTRVPRHAAAVHARPSRHLPGHVRGDPAVPGAGPLRVGCLQAVRARHPGPRGLQHHQSQ